MATKDERPTLLSKVAMFVRNPTKDWSELDRPQHEEESGYDKQALKAMIERKRQNDFVRRREFDQLRKLRSRDASAVAALGRPSLFQSSHATDPDGRAVTLKKIDEIEAQMSKQWWKGKQEGGTQQGSITAGAPKPAAPGGVKTPSGSPAGITSQLSDHFATTAAPEFAEPTAEHFAATEMGSGMAPTGPSGKVAPERSGAALGIESYATADVGFSKSRVFVVDDGEMATDPELEEAAIRFANGDDAGAESGLLEALRSQRVEPGVARMWVAALLDLCRATENRVRFDQVVQEFSDCLDGGRLVWSSLTDSNHSSSLPSEPVADASVLWESPPQLTALAMETLRDVLGNSPMPWHLGWSRLADITSDAMPLLGGLFSSLCNEAVALRLTGSDRLVQVLRAMTPSGNRNTDPTWWAVRLDVLRTLHAQDAFEMAALDYCVTYEDVPPPWQDAQCTLEEGPVQGSGAPHATGLSVDDAMARKLELRGQVTGDATQALAALDGQSRAKERIVVNCQALLRVDFPAAGSILNWVAARQAEGCNIQFRDVHRLVAAFFNVIGINEHAQVVPRAM